MSDRGLVLQRLAVAVVSVVGLAVGLPAADAPFTFDERAGIADNRVVRPGGSFGNAPIENLGDRQGALAAYREFLARGTASKTDRMRSSGR